MQRESRAELESPITRGNNVCPSLLVSEINRRPSNQQFKMRDRRKAERARVLGQRSAKEDTGQIKRDTPRKLEGIDRIDSWLVRKRGEARRSETKRGEACPSK